MTKIVQGDGPQPSRYMFIGERPGWEELRTGQVFVGKAGDEYDKLLWKYGFNRSEVRTDNILADPATGDKGEVTDADIDRNRERVYQEVIKTKPDVIVAMGAVATKFFLSSGKWDNSVRCDVHTVHGIPRIHTSGRTIFPTFNPAAGLHDTDNYQYIYYDFRMLRAYVKGQLKLDREDRYPDVQYEELKLAESVKKVVRRHKSEPIAVDTEGRTPRPWGMSISYQDGEGYVLRTPEAIRAFREYVYDRHPDIVMHYATHDLQICRDGWKIDFIDAGCKIWDTIVLAYLLQVEPQGLKNLAYRHCGMLMQDYMDLVGPYSLDKQVDYLIKANETDWGKPEAIIEEKKLSTKVTNPHGLNRRIEGILHDVMEANENTPVNVWKRWRDIHEAVRNPCEERFGLLPSGNLDDLPIEKAVYYSGRDADATFRLLPRLMDRIRELDLEDCLNMDLGIVHMVEEMQSTKFAVDIPYAKDLLKEFRGEQGRMRKKIRDLIGYSINPESPPDVRKLFFKKLRLPAYKFSKKTRQPSTGDKAVESLRGTHPAVDLTLDHRELDKHCSSFITPAINRGEEAIARGEEAAISGRINYTRVVSGRLSMSKENEDGEIVGMNLMAIPVRNELSKRIRNLYVARPGCYLGSWDLNQIEMRYMAHESQDPFLVDAYIQGKDIHRATAASTFGISEDAVSAKQRYGAKRTGFSVITGITPPGLLDVFRKEGITDYTEDDCKHFIDGWLERCGGVNKYLSACRQEAKQNGYVRESVMGRMRDLPAVWSLDDRIREEALRQSHSHKISSGAQAIMKLIMIELDKVIRQLRSEGEYVRWVLQIHDEIILEFTQGLEAVLDPIITSIMAGTVKLRVPVSGKGNWGVRWGEIKD